MRKVWDIPGGVHPPENKSQSNDKPIGHISLPKEIVLPLNQHLGSPAIPVVNVGDSVLKGQVVAEPQGLVSAPVHASTSGIVSVIEDRAIPHASGLSTPCIVIEPDHAEKWCHLETCEDYTQLEKTELLDKIRSAGLAGLGGAGFPTAVKLNPRANQKIDTLILNGTECEPYITADDVLMRERAEEIIEGIKLFAHLLNHPKHVIVGIEDNKPEAIAAMSEAAEGCAIEISTFPTKYPSGGEKQLIQILTGKEVPSGGIPASMGIVVQNVGTAVAAYRAVRFGEPLISRITTVVGESLNMQRNVEALIGTPINHILSEHGFIEDNCARLIIGGPMMGYAMDRLDVPLIKTTNCVLVPSHEEMPEQSAAQPCIRCGMCAEACPASLLPQQLYWHARAEDVDKLKAHNLFDCIECGACSFVCPSNIPLVQYYRASKGIIRQIENDKLKSDRSRQRFEFRQERIAKAEAAKEEKRLARKKAAEQAKLKLAEKNSAETPPVTNDTAKASNDDPTVQKSKLERAVSSAKSRVERAQSQLTVAQDENAEQTRVESLASRLKQAELKLSEAQSKLAKFESGAPTTTDADVIIKARMSMSDGEKLQKNVETLTKRLATAEQKYSEAQQSDSPHTEALKSGVEKLKKKLDDAQRELTTFSDTKSESKDSGAHENNNVSSKTDMSAADAAIEKAKEKTQKLASMSDEEKAQAQLTSLKTRLEKARTRLKNAEKENNEHLDAFKNSVEKLEAKVKEAEESL